MKQGMRSTRIGYWIYLFVIHLALALMAYFLLRERLYIFLTLELLLLLSFLLGLRFYTIFLGPFRLIGLGKAALADGDFTTHLRPGSSSELNELMRLYNQMLSRLRSERSSKQEKQYFLEKLLHSAPIGVLILDFDGNIHLLNPAMQELLQLPAMPVAGTPLSAIDHPLAKALEASEEDEARPLFTLGPRRYQVERGTFIDRGFPRHFLLVQDVSQQLLETEKQAYGKVIRMMAHEVNNSIGASNSLLRSLVDALEESPQDFPALAAEYLAVVIDRGERMNQFMRHFADVVRLGVPNKRPCDLRQLVERVATLFSAQCRDKNIALSLELAEEKLLVAIDAPQIEQVLINAIKNSMESIGEEGGEIWLRLEKQPLGIHIADNGAGIAPAIAKQLFTPFFSSKQDGQGIGLTLSRDILEQHGARYELYTRGEQTTFSIFF